MNSAYAKDRESFSGWDLLPSDRGNAQAEVFHREDDYAAFVRLVAEAALRKCIARGSPYGRPLWQRLTARQLGLESSLRPRGRLRSRPLKLNVPFFFANG